MNKEDHLSQFNNEEIQAIQQKLQSYSVPLPSDAEIDRTIHALKQYLPTKGQKKNSLSSFLGILSRTKTEISFMNKSYWIISFLIFITGYLTTLYSENPYITIMFFSPIPIIIGFLELFKGREQGILEIELVCKHSPQEIFLARLTIIVFYNLFALSILTGLFSSYFSGELLWKLIITWMTPLTVISSLTLLLIRKLRGGYAVTVSLALWISSMLWLMNTPDMIQKLFQFHLAVYIVIILTGLSLFIIQMNYYMKNELERSALLEA